MAIPASASAAAATEPATHIELSDVTANTCRATRKLCHLEDTKVCRLLVPEIGGDGVKFPSLSIFLIISPTFCHFDLLFRKILVISEFQRLTVAELCRVAVGA
jgi:hypothetical protein